MANTSATRWMDDSRSTRIEADVKKNGLVYFATKHMLSHSHLLSKSSATCSRASITAIRCSHHFSSWNNRARWSHRFSFLSLIVKIPNASLFFCSTLLFSYHSPKAFDRVDGGSIVEKPGWKLVQTFSQVHWLPFGRKVRPKQKQDTQGWMAKRRKSGKTSMQRNHRQARQHGWMANTARHHRNTTSNIKCRYVCNLCFIVTLYVFTIE